MRRGIGGWLGLLVVVAGFGLAPAPSAEEPAQLPAGEVERIVREYLMREPEVIYEALQELQRRQAEQATERQRLALVQNRDALLNDPAAPVGGNPDGDVTLVEFFDYRCTYCRRVVDSVQELLDEDPKLRMVFKELPVLGEESVRAARAALAAKKQDGYIPFHFALMRASDLSRDAILALAEEQGLDPDRLAADMQSEDVSRAIDANYQLANALGIEGTPAFVIGDQLVPGAIDKARMRALIQEARSS
ncbi:MAG TPA: DsbA family protein [Geminicoccaceae bacterium]